MCALQQTSAIREGMVKMYSRCMKEGRSCRWILAVHGGRLLSIPISGATIHIEQNPLFYREPWEFTLHLCAENYFGVENNVSVITNMLMHNLLT